MTAQTTTGLDSAAVANHVVDGLTDGVASLANGIPFLNLGDRIKNSPVVQQMQTDARNTITTQGSDKSTWIGWLISLVTGAWAKIMGALDSFLPASPAPTTPPPAAGPATTPPPASAQATGHDTNGPGGPAPTTPPVRKPPVPGAQR